MVLAIRSLLAQRQIALLLCVAALLLKLLVPAGYMIATERGHVSVTICSGVEGYAQTGMASSSMQHVMPEHRQTDDHGKVEMPCAFVGLSAAALGAIDPVQIADAPASIASAGFVRAMLPMLYAAPYLRPPLRGPPATS